MIKMSLTLEFLVFYFAAHHHYQQMYQLQTAFYESYRVVSSAFPLHVHYSNNFQGLHAKVIN